MIRVAVMLGTKKGRSFAQSINASVNGRAVSWDSDSGEWITNQVDRVRQGAMWYLALVECETGDQLELNVTTWIPGKGHDEDLTFKKRFVVSEENDLEEFDSKSIGPSGYPYLRGRLSEVTNTTERMERGRRIDNLLEQVE